MKRLVLNIFSPRRTTDGFFYRFIKELIACNPRQISLYEEAFLHRSMDKIDDKTGKRRSYERLEFLGDAVLSTIISDWLYNNAPLEQEGYLTQMRSKIVSRKNLNLLGEKLHIASLIQAQTKDKNDLIGDVLEALIGAIYLDQGYEKCQQFIAKKIIDPFLSIAQLENRVASYKSLMIEWAQKNKYELLFDTQKEENANRQLIFKAELSIDNEIISKGRASSKKEAEEIAAKRAYYAKSNQMN